MNAGMRQVECTHKRVRVHRWLLARGEIWLEPNSESSESLKSDASLTY